MSAQVTSKERPYTLGLLIDWASAHGIVTLLGSELASDLKAALIELRERRSVDTLFSRTLNLVRNFHDCPPVIRALVNEALEANAPKAPDNETGSFGLCPKHRQMVETGCLACEALANTQKAGVLPEGSCERCGDTGFLQIAGRTENCPTCNRRSQGK